MSEFNVHNLYKFIKEGVTPDQMFAATKEAYKDADEGKLPADTANIQKPDQYVQDLKEEEKKEEDKEGKDKAENSEIKTDNAGITPEPEKTDVSKDLEKQTPEVDKLVQDKDGKDPLVEPDKVKEEKKEEVKVSDVEKVKAENEGKLPADTANIQKPDQYVQDLKETEKVIAAEISDESVAKDLASKNNAEAVQNPQTRLWKVVSRTAETNSAAAVPAVAPAMEKTLNTCSKCSKEKCECVSEEKVVERPTVDAAKTDKDLSKLEKSKVKEDVDVTIKTDDKEVNIVSADGSTQVTTLDVGTAAPVTTLEEPPITTEAPISEPEPELELEEEPEFSEEEALEMAEKLMVAEHLSKMDEKKMSAKQKKFVEDMKAKKFSKKNSDKIEKKKKEIK